MLEPDVHRGVPEISTKQRNREADLRQVGRTLMEIESAVYVAEKARKELAKGGREPNFVLAIDEAIEALQKTRRTLQQQTYFGGAQQRLL